MLFLVVPYVRGTPGAKQVASNLPITIDASSARQAFDEWVSSKSKEMTHSELRASVFPYNGARTFIAKPKRQYEIEECFSDDG